MQSDNYEQVKAGLWTGKETAAALEALERMHQREERLTKALEDIVSVGDNTHIWRHVRIAREALADTPEVPR